MIFSKPSKSLTIVSCVWLVLLAGCGKVKGTRNGINPPQAKPLEELEKIAQETTVQIAGGSAPGSGVIIKTEDGKYYVLTGTHVVGRQPGPQSKYEIKNYRRENLYEITSDKYENLVQKDPKLDLALIELPGQGYTAAKLSKTLPESQPIFIAGWKNCSSEPQYEFNRGNILKRISSESEVTQSGNKSLYESQDFEDGYRVNYSNPTISGMSGGPLFDSSGRVVAIHGKPGYPKGTIILDNCPSMTPDLGNNWGIPIELFLNSSLAQGKKLEVEKTPIQTPIPPVTPPPPNPPPPPTNDAMFRCSERDRKDGTCK